MDGTELKAGGSTPGQNMSVKGADLPLSGNLSLLSQELRIGAYTAPNRLAVQPMEGCDGTSDGTPDELTKRRYERFAASGAGLIWFEAVAVTQSGRANPRQLMLTEKNLDVFRRLLDSVREISMSLFGYAPILIMQATHSGRYSRPEGKPCPVIAYNNPLFEKDNPIPANQLISDDGLRRLEDGFAVSARLAEMAGFDGVDIKACHRYLLSELLSAYERPGQYGGSFENRTRMLCNAILAGQSAVSGKTMIVSRLNVYDGFPYPYGWGVAENGTVEPELTEPVRLIRQLKDEHGVPLVNLTLGNPYVNPHVNRPFDRGSYLPPEEPLTGVGRACACYRTVKEQVPGMLVIASALSYIRDRAPFYAAGLLEQGCADMAGFGRMAFAYPEFARDILQKGQLDPKRCCIACSKCTELMRAGAAAGCVVRDELYLKIYRDQVLKGKM